MKKLKFLGLAACMFALAACMMAGCSSNSAASSAASESASAESSDAAASSEGATADTTDISTLTVGFDNSYPPYGFIGTDGEYTGIDLDLAAEVATRNGWELKLEPIDWDTKDVQLNQGSINCIWNGFTMEGREYDYAFSEPYMLNEQVIVVKADSGIASEDDLAGKVVITQLDSAALDVLEDEDGKKALADTFGRLDTVSDYNNAFMQLEAGNVDAVACDLSIAAYQMSANPDVYAQLEEPLSSEHYAVGFAKDDTALADKVTATLREMYADGFVEQLCQKYAEYGVDYGNWILK